MSMVRGQRRIFVNIFEQKQPPKVTRSPRKQSARGHFLALRKECWLLPVTSSPPERNGFYQGPAGACTRESW